MTQEKINKPAPYIFPKIFPIIDYMEKAGLVVLAAGIVAYYYTGYFYGIMVSILLFIPTYFLIAFHHTYEYYAYKRKIELKVFSEEESDDSETAITSDNVFIDLILPKILWLSNATSLMSIFFSALNTGNLGYMQGIVSGGFCICMGIIIFLITYIKKEKIYRELGFILLRSIPILLVELIFIIF